jgi:hypothetical protein
MNNRQAANVISGAFRREYERHAPCSARLDPGIAAEVIRKMLDDGLIRPPATMAEAVEVTGPITVPAPPTQRGWGSGWRG